MEDLLSDAFSAAVRCCEHTCSHHHDHRDHHRWPDHTYVQHSPGDHSYVLHKYYAGLLLTSGVTRGERPGRPGAVSGPPRIGGSHCPRCCCRHCQLKCQRFCIAFWPSIYWKNKHLSYPHLLSWLVGETKFLFS